MGWPSKGERLLEITPAEGNEQQRVRHRNNKRADYEMFGRLAGVVEQQRPVEQRNPANSKTAASYLIARCISQ